MSRYRTVSFFWCCGLRICKNAEFSLEPVVRNSEKVVVNKKKKPLVPPRQNSCQKNILAYLFCSRCCWHRKVGPSTISFSNIFGEWRPFFNKNGEKKRNSWSYCVLEVWRQTGGISVTIRVNCLPCEAKKTTQKSNQITPMFLCKYTWGALVVLGMDVNVLDGDRYKHHYTPPCSLSLSLRCHSLFTCTFFIKLYFFALWMHTPSCCPLLLPVPVTVLYLHSPLSLCICCHLNALLFPTELWLCPR